MPQLVFKSLDGFIRYVESQPKKRSKKKLPKDLSVIYKDRTQAVFYEKLIENTRLLPQPVYVTCAKGTLFIEDVGVAIAHGQVLDLTRFPLNVIKTSKGIRSAFANNCLCFVTKVELKKFMSTDFNNEDYGLAIMDSTDCLDDGSLTYKETCSKFINIKKSETHGTSSKIKNPKKVETVGRGREFSDPIEMTFLDTETGMPRKEMSFVDDFSNASEILTYENGTMRTVKRSAVRDSASKHILSASFEKTNENKIISDRSKVRYVKQSPKSGEGSSSFIVEVD